MEKKKAVNPFLPHSSVDPLSISTSLPYRSNYLTLPPPRGTLLRLPPCCIVAGEVATGTLFSRGRPKRGAAMSGGSYRCFVVQVRGCRTTPPLLRGDWASPVLLLDAAAAARRLSGHRAAPISPMIMEL